VRLSGRGRSDRIPTTNRFRSLRTPEKGALRFQRSAL
jgi:hypothetical protein